MLEDCLSILLLDRINPGVTRCFVNEGERILGTSYGIIADYENIRVDFFEYLCQESP